MARGNRTFSATYDRRLAQRRATRLRSGRLFDLDGRFLTDCAIRDRTPLGAAIAVTAADPLPATVGFYDDERRTLHAARLVWRGQQTYGLAFVSQPLGDRHVRGAFGGGFYGLGASRTLTRSRFGSANIGA